MKDIAYGHGVMCSLLGKSEDEALRSWTAVGGAEHWDSVRHGWRIREGCTWRPSHVSVREIIRRAM